MRQQARWLAMAVAMLASTGCSPDRDDLVQPKMQERTEIVRRFIGECTTPGLRAGPPTGAGRVSAARFPSPYDHPAYECGTTVGIVPGFGFPDTGNGIDAAVDEWNGALAAYDGVPVFSTDSTGVDDVWRVVWGNAPPSTAYSAYQYCGALGSGNTIVIDYDDSTHCDPIDTGIVGWSELPGLLEHEMGHIHGFQHFANGEVVDGCAMVVHPNDAFGDVCTHMSELVGYAYGITAYNPWDGNGFRHYFGGILTRGTNATPQPGDTVTVWADTMLALDGSGLAPDGHYPATLVTYDWDVTGPGTLIGSDPLWRRVRIDGYGPITVTMDITDEGPNWRLDGDYPANQGSYLMTVKPPAPDSLSASSVTATTATLSWARPTGTSTLIYRKISGGSWVFDTSTSLSTFTMTGLTPSSDYAIRLKVDAGGVLSDSLQVDDLFQTTSGFGPLPTPGSLSVDHIGLMSATIKWTTTATDVLTRVQINDGTGWVNITGSPAGYGVDSANAALLEIDTQYDVRIWHYRISPAQSSDTVTVNDAFTTLYAPRVTAFTYDDCSLFVQDNKDYAAFTASWTVDGDVTGWSWEIWQYSGFASVVSSDNTGTSGSLGEWMQHGYAGNVNFWIRYVKSGEPDGPETSLNVYPLDVNQCVPAQARHLASASPRGHPLLLDPFRQLKRAATAR